MPTTRHVLSPPVPVRALLLSGLAAVAGALLLVVADLWRWPMPARVAAGVLLVAGVLLAAAAAILLRRLRVRAEFDDDGYRFSGPAGTVFGRWASTRKVTLAGGGHRIVLDGDEERQVLSPAAADSPAMAALLVDLQRRLDASRGYRN